MKKWLVIRNSVNYTMCMCKFTFLFSCSIKKYFIYEVLRCLLIYLWQLNTCSETGDKLKKCKLFYIYKNVQNANNHLQKYWDWQWHRLLFSISEYSQTGIFDMLLSYLPITHMRKSTDELKMSTSSTGTYNSLHFKKEQIRMKCGFYIKKNKLTISRYLHK